MLSAMFAGFPPDAPTFYVGLEADNSKPYWTANRDIYEGCVREPMEDLIEELRDEFGLGKVFRPYRDVRFSKDKRLYKEACGAVLHPEGAKLSVHYVELSAKGLRLGAGAWHFEPELLRRIRTAIDDDGRGGGLQEIAARLDEEGMPLHAPELKTAPRGFAKDHPRIELLRRKRFAATALLEPGPWLHTRETVDRVAEQWRLAGPLNAWLERAAA
jgi:uncharacterized protein (TIGR02453 family)